MNNYRARPNGNRSKSFGRTSRSRFGGGGSSYSPSPFRRRNPYKGGYINHEMYISKAVSGEQESVYDNTMTFSDFHLHGKLAKNISIKGYVHPTKIQAQVIPAILNHKDILGLANTGSGKTAAFLIPMINAILSNPLRKCLIVAPTRELAGQIQQELRSLTIDTGIKDVMVVGGANMFDQARLIKRNPHFVIATPGRLLDIYKRKMLQLHDFDHVILDEVDQMLDMGFVTDIKLIISKLKSPRQSLFFSATLNAKTREIAESLLTNPVQVELATNRAVKNVEQNIVRIERTQSKVEVLHNLLVNADFERVLVFSRTKRGADDIADALSQKGHRCGSLHSDKTLGQRTRILSMFKKDEIDILIATDVASRGIDVPNISHVINYDQPATYEDYIHRIGRTGRVGKKGIALTFV